MNRETPIRVNGAPYSLRNAIQVHFQSLPITKKPKVTCLSTKRSTTANYDICHSDSANQHDALYRWIQGYVGR